MGPQEYGLNKNVDVTLWLESRNFKKYPPLREVHNFVIINEQLHAEFDEFRKVEIQSDYSYLPLYELLHYWYMHEKNGAVTVMTMYGKPHLKLHCT